MAYLCFELCYSWILKSTRSKTDTELCSTYPSLLSHIWEQEDLKKRIHTYQLNDLPHSLQNLTLREWGQFQLGYTLSPKRQCKLHDLANLHHIYLQASVKCHIWLITFVINILNAFSFRQINHKSFLCRCTFLLPSSSKSKTLYMSNLLFGWQLRSKHFSAWV